MQMDFRLPGASVGAAVSDVSDDSTPGHPALSMAGGGLASREVSTLKAEVRKYLRRWWSELTFIYMFSYWYISVLIE
jgi:hypothetical protein